MSWREGITKLIDLTAPDLEEIQAILRSHLPEYEIWAFGSRVGGTARPFSDLDLVVVNSERLPAQRLVALKQAFSDSRVSIKVDLVEWCGISDRFRALISARYEVFQRPASGLPASPSA